MFRPRKYEKTTHKSRNCLNFIFCFIKIAHHATFIQCLWARLAGLTEYNSPIRERGMDGMLLLLLDIAHWYILTQSLSHDNFRQLLRSAYSVANSELVGKISNMDFYVWTLFTAVGLERKKIKSPGLKYATFEGRFLCFHGQNEWENKLSTLKSWKIERW